MANQLRVLVVAGTASRRAALAESVRHCWKPGGIHVEARTSLSGGFHPGTDSVEAVPADVLLADLDTPAKAEALLHFLSNKPADDGAVALLDDPDPRWVRAAMNAGISAILSREADANELRLAFQAAQAGLVLLHPTSARDLATGYLPQMRLDGPAEHLTARENEVLRWISRGLGNKEIAARLKISEHTVKFHTSSILGKLGAGTRTEAVSQGIRQGLIPI